ncbi:cathelicidin-1-like isoform X2 [Scyliorhinus canicula]|uniref:cathelicidin-1-like isoform X2 n=1 Tax=Scyliorhinus canicula TaxID=7830 RepID=UPI0018F4BABC|nr:cathelicidin-1-like isoform X2 [Scyliorhinus canicula]
MKHLQRIVLLVGLVTLTVGAAVSTVTSKDVASAAVAHYNRGLETPNAFKLLRIIRTKHQDLRELSTYMIRLQMKETACSTDVGISEIDGCDFRDDGLIMICASRVLVLKYSSTEPRVVSMNCMPADSQPVIARLHLNPVLARQRGLISNETHGSST